MIFKSSSHNDTFAFANQLGTQAQPGEIYCLSGELGAGKTVFAKGFAKGLGVSAEITSPTFCIVNEYAGHVPFYHFDVYRIENISEMDNIGYDEYFYGQGICLIEWAELVQEILPDNAKFIKITKDIGSSVNSRIIEIKE